MSQQQLVPEPQDGSERGGNEEIYQQPYKVAKSKSGDVPKDEHENLLTKEWPCVLSQLFDITSMLCYI